jgi:hypothetical protein
MKLKRNPWPFGILLTFVLFIAGTVALIVIACRNDADLVSAAYYEEEITYQKELEGIERGLESPARVEYDAVRKRSVVTLPAAHANTALEGVIRLYRPSAAGLDQKIALRPDATGGQTLDATQLQPGLWIVKLSWKWAGAEYRADQKLVITAQAS